MRRALTAAAAGLVYVGLVALPALGQTGEELQVEVTPEQIDTTLGESFDIEVTISNESAQPSPSLVAHIDITDPAQSTSVDPEDWTETLSRAVGVIPPGDARSVVWTLQPISPGSFSLYAVALSEEATMVVASAATKVEVAFTQTLNPEGVLPIVLAGPIAVGALLFLVVRRNRVQTKRVVSKTA